MTLCEVGARCRKRHLREPGPAIEPAEFHMASAESVFPIISAS